MFLEILFRFCLCYAVYKGETPPLPPATKLDKKIGRRSIVEKHPRLVAHLWVYPLNSVLLIECLAILSSTNTSLQKIHPSLCPIETSSYRLGSFNAWSILATALIFTGAGIRIACFRTLDSLFTYEMTIRPNHKLIDFGPYGIVRHPSYTGLVLLGIGGALFCTGPQSYLSGCGWTTWKGLWLLTRAWAIFLVGTGYLVAARGPREDEALHAQFGNEWKEYAARVPYRYIPGVI